MFSRETVDQFRSRFRELPTEKFDSCLAWVERKDAAEVLDNPNAMLHSLLTRALDEHRANPTAATSHSQAGTGSLRPDGSWDRSLVLASPTERLVRQLAGEVTAKRLAPAGAACIIAASPLLAACMGSVNDWPALTATPIDGPGHNHDSESWRDAAWAAAHASTSAAEILKRTVLAAIHDAAF